jgi:hypothetical protein
LHMEFERTRKPGDDALSRALKLFAQVVYRQAIDDFLDLPTLACYNGVMTIVAYGIAGASVALENGLILGNVFDTHAYTTVRCM